MAGDDDQHRRKGKASMTEEQLLKELEEKERRERLAATMQMIGRMTKDDLEKVNKRVNDLLYDIEIPQLWQEMHAADRIIKPEEKPVEQPVQILQNKRSFDLFKDDEEEDKFWEVHAKKMRLVEREAMKKENDSDASEDEDPAALFGYTESELRVILRIFAKMRDMGLILQCWPKRPIPKRTMKTRRKRKSGLMRSNRGLARKKRGLMMRKRGLMRRKMNLMILIPSDVYDNE